MQRRGSKRIPIAQMNWIVLVLVLSAGVVRTDLYGAPFAAAYAAARKDYTLLPSVGRSGMTFEVGACPWGCLVADLYAQSRKLILAALDFIEAHNTALDPWQSSPPEMMTIEVPVFNSIFAMQYPDGYPMIHPALQGRDFTRLEEGDPIFMGLDGGARM